jgi:hypothetical protein
MIADDNGNVVLEKLKETLKLIDKPFTYNIWKSSLEEEGDSFGIYMKNLALPQNRNLGWSDSQFLPEVENKLNYNDVEKIPEKKSNFKLTDEIIDKWGFGYKIEEYEAFEKKYMLLRNNYPEKTAMHTEALLNYIRYRCKEEIATAKGDVKDAKEWSAMAASSATAAKINPSQLSAADLQGGLNSFSEITKIAEQEFDIIKKLPVFTYRPNDAADFIIWCNINYMRKAKGLNEVDYHDIYSFYDRKRDEYIEQYGDPYGIFKDDPTIGNRDNIDKFIKTSYGDNKNE